VRITSLLASIAVLLLSTFDHLHAGVSAPFQFREGLIWVQVNLQGYGPATFLLDSGAGATLLDRRVARAMGLSEGKQSRVRGIGGIAPAYAIDGINGSIGGIPLPTSALAVDLRSVAGTGSRIDGLLGIDFFAKRAVQIDFPARVLRVLEPGESARLDGESLPLSRRNDCFCVRVGVDGANLQWLRFDTGCDSAVEWVSSGKSDRFNGSVRQIRATVEVGSMTLTNIEIGRHTSALFPGEGGLLGNRLFAKHRVTLDAPRKRLVLEQL
jgi:hypothetical protein